MQTYQKKISRAKSEKMTNQNENQDQKPSKKVKIVSHFNSAISTVMPSMKQYAMNDKYRHNHWAQRKQLCELQNAMKAIGGKTRDRLRQKLDARRNI